MGDGDYPNQTLSGWPITHSKGRGGKQTNPIAHLDHL
jgi:hypothetical protein